MGDNDAGNGLTRRLFVRLSGVAGVSAILTGASHNLAAAHPLGRPHPPCPSPPPGGPNPATCGSPTSTDSLWQEVQRCNSHATGCGALQANANDYVFHGTNSHNFITVPTERVNGIECPWISTASAPNYWQDAWNWAHTSPTQVTAPVGLGINSADPGARQLNQLHIHMATTRSLSRSDLITQDSAAAMTFAGWSSSRVSIRGFSATQGQYIPHVYRVVIRQTFSNINLFAQLRDMVGQSQMKFQTLIVIPRPSGLGGGYYIVNSQLTLTDQAHPNLKGSDTCDPLLQLA